MIPATCEETMIDTVRIISLLATGGDEAAAVLLHDEFSLARALLASQTITIEELETAVRLRARSGLLLEHCLVKLNLVDFDMMLTALEQRRQNRLRVSDRPCWRTR